MRKHINDLYEDLRDGHNLISLLEVLSGVKLVSPQGWVAMLLLPPRAPPSVLPPAPRCTQPSAVISYATVLFSDVCRCFFYYYYYYHLLLLVLLFYFFSLKPVLPSLVSWIPPKNAIKAAGLWCPEWSPLFVKAYTPSSSTFGSIFKITDNSGLD